MSQHTSRCVSARPSLFPTVSSPPLASKSNLSAADRDELETMASAFASNSSGTVSAKK